MALAFMVNFPSGQSLEANAHTAISIVRNGRQIDIYATNKNNDLALNALYENIVKCGGTFDVTVVDSAGTADYADMSASYYHDGNSENLHLYRH